MVKLSCAIVGVPRNVFTVTIEDAASVSALKEAIKTEKKNVMANFAAEDLQLFLAKKENSEWLGEDESVAVFPQDFKLMEPRLLLRNPEHFGENFQPEKSQIHVLVMLPGGIDCSVSMQQDNIIARPDVIWYGEQRSDGLQKYRGIDPNDKRTLFRDVLTSNIIRRLDETRVVNVKSTSMTGKSSLATLVSRALVNKHWEERKKAAVVTFSMLYVETLKDHFQQRCGVKWEYAIETLPRSGCMVYMVVDDAQMAFGEPDWQLRNVVLDLVKQVLNEPTYPVRILMLTSCGPSCQVPIHFDERMMIGIKDLNFGLAEVFEYVQKWFKGIACLEQSPSAMEKFCVTLKELTGGHVGLCSVTISKLNEVHSSRRESSTALPSPIEWIHMLQSGLLDKDNNGTYHGSLFEALRDTRAVKWLKYLKTDELDRLERIAYGDNSDLDVAFVDECHRLSILAQTEGHFEFSSPVMWRYFIRQRVGPIVRAQDAPKTLTEMIAQVMQTIDYGSIREVLARTLSSDVPLERAWQLEFYKAVYRCTPESFETSVDVGALFGSSGFVGDFRSQSYWGIELVHEASTLAQHIEQFSPGGRFSSLPLRFKLSDFCLIQFKRIASMENVPTERIRADMLECEKLFVVCYDARMTGVVVFNSAMDIVYKIQA
ncbi:hypothetical protein DVH05_005165 [Phytophthora capsici]|nr:hypothetical protein DVH05_005165 [Phytophthora capsici]